MFLAVKKLALVVKMVIAKNLIMKRGQVVEEDGDGGRDMDVEGDEDKDGNVEGDKEVCNIIYNQHPIFK